jgi:uncharacterized protein YbjT (DUF2867 family)
MASNAVLVIGATGAQGGAVANHLLQNDQFEIYALTRDPESDRAESLAERDVKVVRGDLSDKETLISAMEDVDSVFGVTNYWEHGYDVEIEHGTNLADAASQSGISHLVFTSAGGAGRDTGVKHIESKYKIEQYIEDLDVPTTIVRPVFFMQNFLQWQDTILDGTLALAIKPHLGLQMIDVDDIGKFAVEAFDNSEEYIGEAFEIAGDELTIESMAIRFADITGLDIEASYIEPEEFQRHRGEEYTIMFEWMNEEGFQANIDGLRSNHDIDFNRFEQYLQRANWSEKS